MKKYPKEEEYPLMYASSLLTSLPLLNNHKAVFNEAVSIFQKYKDHPVAADMLIKLAPYIKRNNKSKKK